ncbi:MAG: PQQ-dependent sugar dehydrogenase, partial [Bacteroidetes bacterium]|nr:PQQ-dependent sugar dehydrogenase [Bacteroidota bacterium]
AFHPNYETNGFLYLNYTAADPRRTVIARYRVTDTDPNSADPASETVLLEISQPYSNHNGGQIAFGPDGYLYISTGDGGSGGDPQNNAQNRSNLLGKILRIDVDNPSHGDAYGIPADNPFFGNAEGWAEHIYAWGLRNPWRFSFDTVTGRLWAGDVGQNRFEEVDIIDRGKNYGWRIMEGFSCFNPASGCDQSGLTKPVIEYGRDQGASITGGYVYRGESVPELQGKYIYADFVTGRIWGLTYNGPGNVDNVLLLSSNQNIASFGVDPDNELYICTFGGSIFRFTPTVTSTDDTPGSVPDAISLFPAYPNPAIKKLGTNISLRFSLPGQQSVRLVLYDTLGRELRTITEGSYAAGSHRVSLGIGGLQPGIYYYSLHTDETRLTRKLLVME